MELSSDQQSVYAELAKWVRAPKGVMTLGGYAGTGKSTLLGKLISETEDVSFAAAAYTGKAANVLANKIGDAPNVKSVSTIHKLIYRANEEFGKYVFEKKASSEVKNGVDVLVLDEASMISDDLFDQILDVGLPVLAIGDHGQLPPIDGSSSIISKPKLRLETIHRQAEGNPIIALSKFVRERGRIPVPPPKGVRHLSWGGFVEEFSDHAATATPEEMMDTVVLTYRNATRVEANKIARNARFPGHEKAVTGDLVICLRNMDGVFNGMRGVIKSIDPKSSGHHAIMTIGFPVEDMESTGPVLRAQFGREKTFSSLEEFRAEKIPIRKLSETGGLYDFGYAMTVHKAQGSGFKRVYLIKEKPLKADEDTYKRWLYTAVTRASEELIVVAK